MSAEATPGPIPASAVGPPVAVGEPVVVGQDVVRLTAPNPSVLTGPGTNTYLVGRGEVVVVDPGPALDAHLAAILAAAAPIGPVRSIVVTHHHPDHAPGASELAAATGAPVLAHGHRGGVAPDRRVGDGFVLEAGGCVLVALHTPGHASDHLCWLLEGRSLLFSGDHVMEGSTVVIAPPDGDMAQYLASLEALRARRPPLAVIAPGHGRLIGDPGATIGAVLAHRHQRERLVLAALGARPASTVGELLAVCYPGVSEELAPYARQSLLAHLQKLVEEGRAAASGGPARGSLEECGSTRWSTARLG